MPLKIPGYDIAILSGDLEEKKISDWVFVITEPDFMDKSVAELDVLHWTITELEKYTGVPYFWGIYKISILLPNYPMGAMEHPLLTTASPFLIVGDKSKVWVANHEIAHSWTGNLVTCMNWNHFWLNEGFDVFLEWKISGIMYGEALTKMNAWIGNSSMYEDMLVLGLNN